jgi:membrane protein YdbS with pleckstrin-like domain
MASLILSIVCLFVAGLAGFMWYQERQKKQFIVTTGCALALSPIIMTLAFIGAVVLFTHWIL